MPEEIDVLCVCERLFALRSEANMRSMGWWAMIAAGLRPLLEGCASSLRSLCSPMDTLRPISRGIAHNAPRPIAGDSEAVRAGGWAGSCTYTRVGGPKGPMGLDSADFNGGAE